MASTIRNRCPKWPMTVVASLPRFWFTAVNGKNWTIYRGKSVNSGKFSICISYNVFFLHRV